jgi:hypothetical protein
MRWTNCSNQKRNGRKCKENNMSTTTYAFDSIGFTITLLLLITAVGYIIWRNNKKSLIIAHLKEKKNATVTDTKSTILPQQTPPATNIPQTSIVVTHKQEHALQTTGASNTITPPAPGTFEKVVPREYFSIPKEEQERRAKEHSEYTSEDQAIQNVLGKTMPKESRASTYAKEIEDAFKKKMSDIAPLPKTTGTQRFFLHDGTALEDLAQLRDTLLNMTDEQFYVHVNSTKNDFASWTEGVFAMRELAAHMRQATSKSALYEVLAREI